MNKVFINEKWVDIDFTKINKYKDFKIATLDKEDGHYYIQEEDNLRCAVCGLDMFNLTSQCCGYNVTKIKPVLKELNMDFKYNMWTPNIVRCTKNIGEEKNNYQKYIKQARLRHSDDIVTLKRIYLDRTKSIKAWLVK